MVTISICTTLSLVFVKCLFEFVYKIPINLGLSISLNSIIAGFIGLLTVVILFTGPLTYSILQIIYNATQERILSPRKASQTGFATSSSYVKPNILMIMWKVWYDSMSEDYLTFPYQSLRNIIVVSLVYVVLYVKY